MGFIFGDGTAGMLFGAGALLLFGYLYLWFAKPSMAIDITEGVFKGLFKVGLVIFKLVFGIMKWVGSLLVGLFGGRR